MKPTIFMLLVICCTSSLIAQDTKTVNSNVSAITLYTMGAVVTETGNMTLNKGDNKLMFTGIPATLNTTVLLLQYSGNARVVSLTSGSMDISTLKQDKPYKTLLDSMALMAQNKLGIDQTIGAYNNEKIMIDANQSIGGANNGLLVAELQKAADFYRARMADINRLLLAVMKEQSEIARIQSTLEQRKLELERRFYLHNNVIYATVSSDNASNETFELRYFVDGCGWAPFYDIKITDIAKPVALVYQAKLFNNTGVDWQNINLTISTADPGKTAQYPTLEKWELGQMSAPASFKRKSANGKAYNGDYYNSKADKAEDRKDQLAHAETIISASELTVDFAIAEKKTIPSDARPYLVEIKTHQVSPSYRYIAIPKLDLQGYLTCGLTDWEQYNLIEGRANVYFGNTFIGESYIAPQNADDTLEISLGRDQKVALKYEKKKDYSRKSLMGGTIIQSFSYEITIRNNNDKDIAIDLFDQVPISANSDITVDVNDISKADWNKEDGKLSWQVTLKSGETAKYIVSYTVKYPKGKPLQIRQFRPLRCPDF